MTQPNGLGDKAAFVWKVPDKLRGPFKPHQYGSVGLPLLRNVSGQQFDSTSKLTSITPPDGDYTIRTGG